MNSFFAVAARGTEAPLAEELRVIFLDQHDEADSIDWEFEYKQTHLTLHYNIFNGVSISSLSDQASDEKNHLIKEVVNYLNSRSF